MQPIAAMGKKLTGVENWREGIMLIFSLKSSVFFKVEKRSFLLISL